MDPLRFKVRSRPHTDARIVKAACHDGKDIHDAKVTYIAWRHHVILHTHFIPQKRYMSQQQQGFVCQRGFFWTREQAAKIALRSGQVKGRYGLLTSEDLWDKDGVPRKPGVPYDPLAG